MVQRCSLCRKPRPVLARLRGWDHRSGLWRCPVHGYDNFKQCLRCKEPKPVLARLRGWRRSPGGTLWYCPVHWRDIFTRCQQCKEPRPVLARWRGWRRSPGGHSYCPVHWREWNDPDVFANTGATGREQEVTARLKELFSQDYFAGRPYLLGYTDICRVRFIGSGDHIRVFVDFGNGDVVPGGVVRRSMTPEWQAKTIRESIHTFTRIASRIREA